ncbi:hypothetical protein FRC11_001343, partial [Ceratobasidium sp. 423]
QNLPDLIGAPSSTSLGASSPDSVPVSATEARAHPPALIQFGTKDLASSKPVPLLVTGADPSCSAPSSPYGQDSVPKQTFGQDCTTISNLPHTYTSPTVPLHLVPMLNRPVVPSCTPTHMTRSAPSSLSTRLNRPSLRPTSSTTSPRGFFSHSFFTRAPKAEPPESCAKPRAAYPWNRPDTFERLDMTSRTTAHTAISDILLNYDLDTSTAADLIQDACQTARQVGVSTHDLLSRTVFSGNSDLGITPLCLEASRVDMEEGGTELVQWLIENTGPSEVPVEIKKGCLMRLNGMGEQGVWNVLKSFVPVVDGETPFAYEVDAEGLADVALGWGGAFKSGEMWVGEDQESACGDVSTICAGSSYPDQEDTETLKFPTDKIEMAKEKEEVAPPRVHRARIIMPLFKEFLLGPDQGNKFFRRSSSPSANSLANRVLTTEWMFEGRIWALLMSEDSLLLKLQQISPPLSPNPIQVKAVVRIFSADSQRAGIEKVGYWIKSLLSTQTPGDAAPPNLLYECELEGELVPGSVRLDGKLSAWKTEIQTPVFSLLKLVGSHRGIAVEVVVRVSKTK